MAERHRGYGREFERGGGGGDRGRRGGDGPRGPRGREGRDGGDRPRRGPGGFGGPGRPSRPGGFGAPGGFRAPGGPATPFTPYREARPPAAPEEVSEYQEVDADLAIAILDTATRLTEIVGTSGLPEGNVERRQAVVETFEVIYFSILESITGGGEDEDVEEETEGE